MKRLVETFSYFFLLFLIIVSLMSNMLVGKGYFDKTTRHIYAYDPYQCDKSIASLSPPTKRHILGTDLIGRDILARLIKGTANSFFVSFVATVFSLFFGLVFGGLAGYLGGVFDFVFSRIFEIFFSLPVLFVLILLSPLIRANLFALGFVLGLLGWLFVARLIRSEVMKLKESEFVSFAKANGAGFWYLFSKHFLPHSLPPIITVAIFGFSSMLVAESSLSFLGVGVRLPEPSWGTLIAQGLSSEFGIAYWIYVPPVVLLFLTILSLDIISESIKKKLSRF